MDVFLDILELLRVTGSAAIDDHQLFQYLAMLDERADPSENGLEGREPFCRLFCNIEEYFCTVHDPLP